MLVVEASFVFPIMFIVLLFLLYFGNIFYQKSVIDNMVNKYAIKAASHCSDSNILVENGNVVTGLKAINPYRNFSSHGDYIEELQDKLKNKIVGTGFFIGMRPTISECKIEYHNEIIYSTISAEVNYSIKLPVRYLGQETPNLYTFSSRANVPVVNTSEFVRNSNMAMDYLERSDKVQDAKDKIEEAIDKVKKFFKKDSE